MLLLQLQVANVTNLHLLCSRDWLTLLEEMQKNEKADISDFEHICHMLDRQRVSKST